MALELQLWKEFVNSHNYIITAKGKFIEGRAQANHE